MMIKKWTAFLLSCSLLFLSACGISGSQDTSPQTTITLIMDTSASPGFTMGAEYFSSCLTKLSDGKMSVEIVYSPAPLEDTLPEENPLYFLSYQAAREQVPALVALELPYLMNSVRMAGDVLSSLQISDYVNHRLEGTGLISLSGVPCGKRYFTTRKRAFQIGKQEIVGFASPYYSINALPSLSENIRVADWSSLLKNYCLSGFEIPLWKIPMEQAYSLKISPSAHSYEIGWIWAKESLLNSLSPTEQAWLKEAVVRTCGAVQERSVRSDQEILGYLLLNGMVQTEQPLYPSLQQLPLHNVTYKTCLDTDLLNLVSSFYFE